MWRKQNKKPCFDILGSPVEDDELPEPFHHDDYFDDRPINTVSTEITVPNNEVDGTPAPDDFEDEMMDHDTESVDLPEGSGTVSIETTTNTKSNSASTSGNLVEEGEIPVPVSATARVMVYKKGRSLNVLIFIFFY